MYKERKKYGECNNLCLPELLCKALQAGYNASIILNIKYMKGYVGNIEKETEENENFRKVLYTAKFSQLVVMALKPLEEIGEETHTLDQFIRIEKGTGKAILDGVESQIEDGFAVVVPAGTKHNFVNTSETEMMKLYTIYSPPEHCDGTVHATKEDAQADTTDEFEGKTTE